MAEKRVHYLYIIATCVRVQFIIHLNVYNNINTIKAFYCNLSAPYQSIPHQYRLGTEHLFLIWATESLVWDIVLFQTGTVHCTGVTNFKFSCWSLPWPWYPSADGVSIALQLNCTEIKFLTVKIVSRTFTIYHHLLNRAELNRTQLNRWRDLFRIVISSILMTRISEELSDGSGPV